MNSRLKLTVKEIAMAGMMIAVIEACKMALSFAPNIELTSFWLIMFTLYFGKIAAFIVPAFILIEGSMYGFGLWWIMYLYTWPLLVFLTWIFKRHKSALFWALFSGAFGLGFGALCSIPYIFIGASSGGGLISGFRTAFAWWIAGIPWDVIHCCGNFVLMLILFVPVQSVMSKIQKGFSA